jgi:hypothetical protein
VIPKHFAPCDRRVKRSLPAGYFALPADVAPKFRVDRRFNAAKFLIEGVASSDVKQYSFFVETDFAGG